MPLKVLVIDRAPPVNQRQGNALIGVEVLSRLAHHDLTLVAPAVSGRPDAADDRMLGHFREVHLVPRSRWTPALTGSVEPLLAERLPAAPAVDLRAARAISRLIRELGRNQAYDVVHVRQLPMAGYGELLSGVGRLLELIDSETLAAERAQPATMRTRLRALAAARAERRAMRPFDVVTTVAQADAARLHALSPTARIEVIPNGVDADRFRPRPDIAPIRASLVFVGVMSYPPNIAAMRYFAREVLPALREDEPDAHLTIVGRDPTPEVRALASPAVEVTGEVDDVRPYLARASIFVAPMVSGSGIKNKVLEAMAMARPVVATKLAVEGVLLQPGEHVVVAEGATAFAAAITQLLADNEQRRKLGDAGRQLVEREYTWDACAARYDRLYHDLADRDERQAR